MPLVGNTEHSIKRVTDFTQFIQLQRIAEDELIVSFDVISLFTKVPTRLAVKTARQRLEADESLKDRTSLTVDEIIHLLQFCLDATSFTYKGNIYKQIFGTAMGSPVSVVVADLVMESVEQRALATADENPKFWKRYVDDTLTVIKRSQLLRFHEHLNSIEPSIQFTVEQENNKKIPFLDVLLTREMDESITTSVYRKQSNTDAYLNFDSNHPTAHKEAVVRTLLLRARTHTSNTALKEKEEKKVFQDLVKN